MPNRILHPTEHLCQTIHRIAPPTRLRHRLLDQPKVRKFRIPLCPRPQSYPPVGIVATPISGTYRQTCLPTQGTSPHHPSATLSPNVACHTSRSAHPATGIIRYQRPTTHLPQPPERSGDFLLSGMTTDLQYSPAGLSSVRPSSLGSPLNCPHRHSTQSLPRNGIPDAPRLPS